MNKITKILNATIVCSVLAGCSAINPYTGEEQASDSAIGSVAGAGGGALIGGLLGGKVGALAGAAVGGLTGGLIGHHFDRENAELRQRLVGTGVQVKQEGRRIQLVMPSDVTFGFNQSLIKLEFYGVLHSIALVLKKYPHNTIRIVGYTDNIGKFDYNQILSEKRANSVARYLISQGISKNRIFTKGKGERDPIASNNSTLGRQENRRVTLTLTATA